MNLSFQLYSARNFLPWNTHVEGFGGVYENVPAFRDLLDSHGLTMPSGHFFPVSELEEGLEASLTPEDLWRDGTDSANWISLAKRLNEAGKRVNDAGFKFAWHNHHWEFMPLATGELPMNLLLEHAPEMEWEMDVAWVVQGGADPMNWIEEHASRISTAHIKDIAPEGEKSDEDGWADVGDGVMDWKSLIAALRNAGTDLFIVEHDNPSDWDRFASRSINACNQFWEKS